MAAGTALLCSTLLLVHAFVTAEPTFITAESGQDVTLTCQAPNNNFKGVTWSRVDLLPECVLMYQDGHFVPDNQHSSFKNRVDLQDRQMKDGDMSLILKDVTINDAGIYHCDVLTEEWSFFSFSFIFRFLIVVPPDPTIITAESGQDVTLTCRVQNNDNIVVVAWFRDDLADERRAPNKNITAFQSSTVDLGYGYVFLDWDGHFPKANQHPSNPSDRMDLQDGQKEDGEVCLILKDVTINDAGKYVFIALMPETTSLKSISSINLRVPPDLKIIKAESGQDVTLTCQAPDNKITTVKWSRADFTSSCVFLYQDGHFIPDDQHPSFRNRVDLQDRKMKDGDVSLILKDVTINETGTYECRVLREETLRWRSVSFIYLYVDPPDPTIITAESGQDVTLTCRAPNNNFKGVTWSRIDLLPECVLMYQDGHFDPDNQHPSFKNRVDLQDRQMKDGDVSLILKDVTINDTGTYECRVSREEVWAFSFILLVVVPPDPTIITAESGQDVTLTCRVQNNDNIVVVAWFRADLADESRGPNKNITAVEWSRVGLGYGYVFLDWDGHFPKANQHPSNPSDHMDLQDGQKEDGEVCLILKDVTINDTGTYVFIALMPETLSWKSISSINLRVPPDPKAIKAESGQDVILTCRAPNNKITTVKWSRADFTSSCVFLYQDGDFIPDEQHPSFKNRVDLQDRQMKDGDVSLILKDVTINETGTYMCRVHMEEPRIERPHLELISIIHLTVVAPPGPSGGIIGLIVVVLLLLVGVGFLIYRKHKVSRYSYEVPTENNEAPQPGLEMTYK